MRRSKIIRDQRSVLNTDAYDKRRFQEMFMMSEGLQRVRDEADFPWMESLLGDMWASFYKMKPQIVEDHDPALKVNRTLLETWMNHERFGEHRENTRLNELSATISTVLVAEKLSDWMADQKERDGEFARLLEAAEQTLPAGEPGGHAVDELADVPDETLDELDNLLQLALTRDGDGFAEAAEEAMDETLQVQNNIVSLLGQESGKGAPDLKKVPLRDQLAVADQVAHDIRLQNIAEWAGRFKGIARDKRKEEYADAMERRGVTFGNELDRLLPSELGMYKHPVLKTEFLRRFAEKETMQFDQKKRSDLGKGPIVFCLDQSTSMRKLENQSKGFVLALLSIAKRQHRDLCVILFSTESKCLTYKKGLMAASDLIELAGLYLGGGTDFGAALEQALSVIEDSGFEDADVVFVTDGEDEVDKVFLEAFLEKKEELGFQVLSLLLGTSREAVEAFSDEIIDVDDFNDEGSYRAFEL